MLNVPTKRKIAATLLAALSAVYLPTIGPPIQNVLSIELFNISGFGLISVGSIAGAFGLILAYLIWSEKLVVI